MEARDEAEVKLADAVARQREAEDLARATALSARDIYGHEERKGGDSDTDYSDDEDAAPLAMLQPGPMAGPSAAERSRTRRGPWRTGTPVVFSTEDVDLERALAASLAETSAKDDELERGPRRLSRGELCATATTRRLRAVLRAREASAPAVADEPDEVIDDAVAAASPPRTPDARRDAERTRPWHGRWPRRAAAYAALRDARPLAPPSRAPVAARARDAATALGGGEPQARPASQHGDAEQLGAPRATRTRIAQSVTERRCARGVTSDPRTSTGDVARDVRRAPGRRRAPSAAGRAFIAEFMRARGSACMPPPPSAAPGPRSPAPPRIKPVPKMLRAPTGDRRLLRGRHPRVADSSARARGPLLSRSGPPPKHAAVEQQCAGTFARSSAAAPAQATLDAGVR